MNFMQLFFELANRVGLVIMLALVFSVTKVFKQVFVTKEALTLKDKLIMALFYGGLGILGSVSGIAFKGAIVNARVIGVVVGGLLGGPTVGLLSGVIAGAHRYFIDPVGMTSFACAISTISEGLLAGLLSERFKRSNNPVLAAWLIGTLAEILQMSMILIMVKPHDYAVSLVSIIGGPMIVMNAIGIALFIVIIENIKRIKDSEVASRAQQALKIADETTQYFKKGLNSKSSKVITNKILEMTDFKAVAITDKHKILAHAGFGEEHRESGHPIETDMTKHVLLTGEALINQNTKGVSCLYEKYKLNSAVVVPLKLKEDTIGTLKLYKEKENSISLVDEELARGLSNLFSTQLELSHIETQEALRQQAELNALQAQINPHFLFNAINTIVSLIRTDPNNARELLIHLGNYFRNNMQFNRETIPIKDELKNIDAYLKIEKARFGEKLWVEYNVASDLEFEIPPLLIQPLVENAVKHGIFPKVGQGTIKINIFKDECINIVVQDDGVGMTKEKKKDAIGLKNVQQRLKTFYGDQYVFDIVSAEGEGTKVHIRLCVGERND